MDLIDAYGVGHGSKLEPENMDGDTLFLRDMSKPLKEDPIVVKKWVELDLEAEGA